MKPEIDFLAEYDEPAILAELRRVTSITGSDTVTKADLKRVGRMNPSTVVRRFGSLRRALELAGLRSRRLMKPTDEELLGMLVNLWQRVLEREGRTPRKDDLKAYKFPVSSDTFSRRSTNASGVASITPTANGILGSYNVTAVVGAATATFALTNTSNAPIHGDANGDGLVTPADIFYLINFLFAGGPAPIGYADATGDGLVTVADAFYLINFLFAAGPAPL